MIKQDIVFWDKFYQTFRDEADAVVFAVFGALFDDVSDISKNLLRSHFLGENFFTNQGYIRLSLQSTFQSDVGCGSAHQTDEMPVLLSRKSVV